MKKVLFLAIVACILFISCGEKNDSSGGKMDENSIEYFIKMLDLKVDGKYKEALVERKHKTDRVAPAVVRDFIEVIGPTRFSFSQGTKCEEEKATLWWFISEFGVRGKPEEVMETIRDVLVTKHGFVAEEPVEDENGWQEFSFVKDTEKMSYLVKMKELDRFIGSKEPMCGGDVIIDITSRSHIDQPTVGGMVKAYPEIACPELPEEILNYLREKKVKHMKYGGTWERYYTWGVSIPAQDADAARAMLEDVEGIAGKLGFELWKEEDGRKTYQRKGQAGETSSFLDLEIDDNILEIHYQPKS